MPILELQIVQSSQEPEKVSLRPLNRAVSGLRRELTAAGFKPGDRVIILDKGAYEILVRAKRNIDSTVEIHHEQEKG